MTAKTIDVPLLDVQVVQNQPKTILVNLAALMI